MEPVCPRLLRLFVKVFVSFACAFAFASALAADPDRPAGAAPDDPGDGAVAAADGVSRVVGDMEDGEEEEIERRREWFYAGRRQGTTSDAEMARLRAAGAALTARAIDAQRARRHAGTDAPVNFWTSVGPAASRFGGWAFGDVSGRMTGIARAASGNVYIATAAGGVWKTTNNGLSWTNIFENAGTQPTGAIAVDPNDEQTLWVGTGDFVEGCEGYFGIGMLRSTDGGQSWVARNGAGSGAGSLEDASAFSAVVVDPRDSNIVVAGATMRGCGSGAQTSGGLFRTSDGGATWSKRIADVAVHQVVQDETNRNTWWASTNQGVYRSLDNAVTWTKITASGLPSANTGRTEVAVAPSNGNYVYVLFESSGFWRSTNGGSSWTQMSTGSNACDGQCWYNMTIAVHRTNPDIVYRGTILIFRSANGGSTWTQLINGWGGSQQVHQDIHVIVMDPSVPDGFYVGGDGGIWRSADGGTTYTNMNAGLPLFLFYAVESQAGNPAIVCGGAQDNSSLARTTTNLWDLQAVTGDGFICEINAQEPNVTYITSYPGSYPSVSRSTTGILGSYYGITGAGSGIVGGDRINWVTPYTLDPNDGRIMLLGTHRIYRSTNYGTSWTQVGPLDATAGGGTLKVLEFSRTDSRVAYSGSDDGRVWRTTDNGLTWTNITANLPSGSVNDVAADPEDRDRALAVLSGFNRPHLYEWTAAEGTWRAIGNSLPNVPANAVFLKTGGEVYVGTDVGVFRSVDRGETFAPFMDGLPQGLVVTDLRFDSLTNTITAGTYGRGAYQVSVDPPGPILLFDSTVQPMTQVDGDGDASVEPGETWAVIPVLRNAGGLAATAVTARLATATPGVTIAGDGVRPFGTIAPGATAQAQQAVSFLVGPSFACGGAITFDVRDITSTDDPGSFGDRLAAFQVTVVNNYAPPIPATLLDEDFDPNPTTGWTHEKIQVQQFVCLGVNYRDDWKFAQKDAAHGQSFHCGNGPGTNYNRYINAWLYYGGKDSADGPGIVITPGAMSATLTITHWYKAQINADGGFVAVDALEDNSDSYAPIAPVGGYTGTLATNQCNAQEGRQAFTGNSGGWITSTFDLTPYIGRKIYLAFIFGSDRNSSTDEGWYIDQVRVTTETRGAPLCDVTRWAGTVPPAAQFARGAAAGTIVANWPSSCTAAGSPGQLYSIQAGSLDTLRASGTYTHAAVAGDCARTSPATFAAGAGNQYFLVVPNLGGRDGGAGAASSGAPRPQADAACGLPRAEVCP